jgi:Protein of unknown function (DUF2612)
MALIDDQADYYAGLLLSEYANSPRAVATIRQYVKQALGDMLAAQLDAAFTLDTAVGVQLDILGKYIGLPRTIGLPDATPYFQFSDYVGPVPSEEGFTDYLNVALNGPPIQWYNYLDAGTENTALNDSSYLFMLKMQIVLNVLDGTLATTMAFLQLFFPGQIRLVDNQNMTVTYYLGFGIPVPPQVLVPYLPRPLGVTAIFINVASVTGVPSSISASLASHSFPIEPITATVTGTPTAGTGPYAYQWIWVSGTTDTFGNQVVYPTNPLGNTSAFFYNRASIGKPATATAVFYLQATDSNGVPFISNNIAVTLNANLI